MIGQLYADKSDYHTICRLLSYLLADNWVICMLSLRCRLLQYAVFVGINGWHGNNIFLYFLFHFPNKSIISLPCLFSPLTMYNKTIIGFGFSDMQNYQCLASTLIIPHITKTSSNNCLSFYSILIGAMYRLIKIIMYPNFILVRDWL